MINARIMIVLPILLLSIGLSTYAEDLNTELLNATKKIDVTTVRDLLAKGANVNARDTAGKTALMWAADNNNETHVKLLLEKGSAVNEKDSYKKSALMYAAQGINPYIIIKSLLATVQM